MIENIVHFKSALQNVQQQFEEWRNTRKKRGPIPDKLWRAAKSLYPEYSLYHISKALRLNYSDLKGRIDRKQPASIPSTIDATEFIELELNSPMRSSECFVEMEDPFGAKMRMHVKGGACLDLLELGRIFLSRRS